MPSNAFAAAAYATTQSLAGLGSVKKPAAAPSSTGSEFGSLLRTAVDGVAQAGRTAETQAAAAMAGKADIVDVVTAVAESEAALETLVAVRDRVIAAYEEIMRMPI